MKKILGLCLLILTSTAFAETKFSIGAGVNFNTIDTEDDLDDFEEEISANLAAAGKAEIGISEQFSIRTGVWLQEKSAEISYDKNGIDGSLKVNTSYVSIPLNLQVKANDSLSFFGGYIADFRINDYCTTDGDFDQCSLDDDSESVVHLATAGASFQLNQNLGFDVSLQHGLTDVYEDGYKIHTFQVMCFYKF